MSEPIVTVALPARLLAHVLDWMEDGMGDRAMRDRENAKAVRHIGPNHADDCFGRSWRYSGSGYNRVGPGAQWPRNAGEDVVCDACMWQDPRYIERWGDHRTVVVGQ